MKKITTRLIQQFVGLLLVFATMIALFFGILFAKQTEDLHQEEMTHRSELISKTLADYFDNTPRSHTNHDSSSNGYGAFLRFLNQIAGEDIWILDEQMNSLIDYHHLNQGHPPANAKDLVTDTFKTKKTQVTKKREFFQLQELSVGTPILLDGKIKGVVLMRSQVDAIHKNQLSGYWMLLVSLFVSVLIASLLAWRLSKRFVKPIEEMRIYADQLAQENYQAPLAIQTKDELQELGDQLKLLSQRLTTAKKARENKTQAEKDFLSQISHELRTPVMVIKSSLEAINEGLLNSAEEKAYLQQLLLESTNLERLVNDLLELSRLQSVEFRLQKEKINLLDCIDDAIRSYRLPLKEKQQQIQISNQLDTPRMINGDYLRITQALKILIDNANKYAPNSSMIILQITEKGEYLELILENSLMKPLTDVSHLFDSFQRIEQNHTSGTGLGLAIAKQVIHRHQGKIRAEADENRFRMILLLPYL
ncbi:MAG: HAMP domain-containing sensor histidine kinase [Enterococcus malodoratus]